VLEVDLGRGLGGRARRCRKSWRTGTTAVEPLRAALEALERLSVGGGYGHLGSGGSFISIAVDSTMKIGSHVAPKIGHRERRIVVQRHRDAV